MIKYTMFIVSYLALTVGFTHFAHSGETKPFLNQCLSWKKAAGFNPDRIEVQQGCSCIGQQLSLISPYDHDIAKGYLEFLLKYPGRTRKGLQDYFLEKVAQNVALQRVQEEQSTRVFNYLGRAMSKCKSNLPSNN